MSTLLALVEKHLGSEWLDVVRYLRQRNGLEDVAARIEAGDQDGAIQGVEDAAQKYATAIDAAFREAGTQQAAWLDDQVETALIRFDQTNPYAVKWAEQNQLDLVRGLTQEQQQTIRQVLVEGIKRGDNPLTVARDLRESIGLTPAQEQWAQNYRRALETGDWSDALGRELSDGRTDRTVTRLQRDGGAMTQEQIDTAVSRYRDNMHKMRAETIARSEGLRALHEGSEEALRQAIASGDVEAGSLVREWNHAGGGRHSRPGHVEMDGDQQPVGQPFVNPMTGAQLRYPGDPSAGGAETVNCRCCLSTRMVA